MRALKRFPGNLFRDALRIDIGGVDEIDPVIKRLMNHVD
jgi:hypothetical protein